VHRSVRDFRAGDEVFSYVCHLASSGTYAEYLSVPAELVARKPVSLSHEQAASVPVAGITAIMALAKVRAEAAESLFIAGGAGGVGTFAIMLAHRLGIANLVTTAGNPRSSTYLVERCGLAKSQIVDYKASDFVAQAMKRNGGPFAAVVDLVGGRMLTACTQLVAIDGDLASITEAPNQDDFETLFQRNASFHSVGANAYSLSADRSLWLRYRTMLDHLSSLFDGGAMKPPPIAVLGPLSVEVVKKAHALLEKSAVQGKLVMTC
jgi:NADPH:quinone reductase